MRELALVKCDSLAETGAFFMVMAITVITQRL